LEAIFRTASRVKRNKYAQENTENAPPRPAGGGFARRIAQVS
jgi:hypothetical protein